MSSFLPRAARMLFSATYFMIDWLPAWLMSCVEMYENWFGGSMRRAGMPAHAALAQVPASAVLTSLRISCGDFVVHAGKPEAPFATFDTLVTRLLLVMPVAPLTSP